MWLTAELHEVWNLHTMVQSTGSGCSGPFISYVHTHHQLSDMNPPPTPQAKKNNPVNSYQMLPVVHLNLVYCKHSIHASSLSSVTIINGPMRFQCQGTILFGTQCSAIILRNAGTFQQLLQVRAHDRLSRVSSDAGR